MPKHSRPRYGSLQYYPRKKAVRIIPNVNWEPVENSVFIKPRKEQGVLGFLAYKVGMSSAIIKDDTPDSMTKGKRITIPVTVLEVPAMKVYSVRFYKFGKVLKDVIVSNDKDLKRVMNIPQQIKPFEQEMPKEYDDIRVIVYSLPKQAELKKTPDVIEVGIKANNKEEKLNYIKTILNKELNVKDFLQGFNTLDMRGLTKGKGLSGTVARSGISLKSHKSEKGVRRPGSLGPWHPARVTYFTPQAGQLGFYTRVHYNQTVIKSGNIQENNINPKSGFPHYGFVKSSFVIVKGSVQGPPKRVMLLTPSFRLSKKVVKRKYEFVQIAQ